MFNVSTTAAIVAASAGVPVAKHGNRSITSRSGSADVLQELGVNINAGIPQVESLPRQIGDLLLFCTANAPLHESTSVPCAKNWASAPFSMSSDHW